MSLFLSTYINKVDRKGRVSVPAPFRLVLGGQPELIVFRSLQAQALDACSTDYMNQLADALDNPNLDDALRETIETTVFGGSQRLPIDPEGRVVLPEEFSQFAAIGESAAFVGRRRTFQIWDPAAFERHQATSRDEGRANNISLSTILARTNALTQGPSGRGT